MTNFQNKILNGIKNSNEVDSTVNYLSDVQNNLLKNYSNPAISNIDKNTILNEFSKIDTLKNQIYKYSKLKENDLDQEAETEKDKISNLVLKSGINYYQYIWHAENTDSTCEKCRALDGTIFEFENEIPERPHSNCKCTVEMIKASDKNENKKYNNEPCDCWEQISEILNEVEELDSEISSDLDEINNLETEINNNFEEYQALLKEIQNINSEIKEMIPCYNSCIAITGFATNIPDDSELENRVYEIIKNIEEAKQVYEIFIEHKQEMTYTAGSFDKYYHAKANCESAELGIIQTMWATLFSIAKEIKDFKYKVFDNHQDFKKVFIDCMQDLKADLYGLLKAKEHGYYSDKVKDIGNIYKK